MKTILITAYAVNPYKGSEDGSGWNFIKQAARFNKVIAITRQNNAPDIERYIKENPEKCFENLKFKYFDLPYWMRFWKRKNRGALLYFYLWQMALPNFIKKEKTDFDIVHNLNFHNDWTPTFLHKLGKPLVWGPVEHHPPIPKEFIRNVYGFSPWLIDRLYDFTKNFLRRYNPAIRKAYKKAEIVIAGHSGVLNKLPVKVKRIEMMSLVGADVPPTVSKKKKDGFTVISIGRFVPLKGFDITVKAFARFYNRLPDEKRKKTTLELVGKGALKDYLVKLGKDSGLGESLKITEWMPANELTKKYNEADVFLFPSHEGAGMVVVEALSFGLPVICFDNNGPGEIVNDKCAFKVRAGDYDSTVETFAGYLTTLYENRNLRKKMSDEAKKTFLENYYWNKKGEKLRDWYNSLTIEK